MQWNLRTASEQRAPRWCRMPFGALKPIGLCAAVSIGVVLLNVILRVAGLQWSLTGSMPRGLYRVTHSPLTRGQVVAVCLPQQIAHFGWERGYMTKLPPWLRLTDCPGGYQALLKQIAAVSGDVIEIQAGAVTVNGRRIVQSATREVDSKGRPLPHVPWGTYALNPGALWLLATAAANSWDSRYYGPVSVTDVVATARPLLIVDGFAEATP